MAVNTSEQLLGVGLDSWTWPGMAWWVHLEGRSGPLPFGVSGLVRHEWE